MELLGLNLVLTCQRVDCDAQAVIDIGWAEQTTPADIMAQAVEDEEIEPGWGFDMVGVNKVFHCPKHRGAS